MRILYSHKINCTFAFLIYDYLINSNIKNMAESDATFRYVLLGNSNSGKSTIL